MKKIICFVIAFLTMLTCGIIFLSPNVQEVEAEISGTDGAQFILTGYVDSSPESYFTTSNGGSTLVNAQIQFAQYVNKKGETADKLYYLTGHHTSSSKAKSSGTCEIYPTAQMQKIISTGQMMVKASAGLLALDNNERSKVNVTMQVVAGGEVVKTLTFTSDKVSSNSSIYEPDWVETELVSLPKNTEKIVYYFESRDVADRSNAARFCIFEPIVYFATNLTELEFSTTDQSIRAGQVLKLSASNIITNQISSEYFDYYNKIHKISFEIVEGQKYATIVGNYLYVEDSMPYGEKIVVRAKCRKSSLSGEYLYSQTRTFTFDVESTTLEIEKDFENPATIFGGGKYYVGDYATVSVEPNSSFEFVGWEISGKIVSTSKSYTFVVEKDQKIKAKFIKNIKIGQIAVKSKVYDGTTDVQFEIELDGLEPSHDVKIELPAKFATSNVGENKPIEFLDVPSLFGEDADLYQLDTNVPNLTGTITKRPLQINAHSLSKTYGDNDPNLTFDANGLADGEQVLGSLSRTAGEDVGEYAIAEGDIVLKNPNYKINFVGKVFKIEKREIILSDIGVVSKTFDKKTDAQMYATIQNVVLGDDVKVQFNATFVNADAGKNKTVNLSSISIIGEKSKNYFVGDVDKTFIGTISPKVVDVVVKEQSFSYGDEIDIKYSASGLLDGDKLVGKLDISSNQVGSYVVSVGTLSNPNYEIVLNAQLVHVVAKKIVVTAISSSKEYGEVDPILTYEATGLVDGDTLGGNVVRVEGEDVGTYEIGIGTLFNDNYAIDFKPATFEIVKRMVDISFDFEDKTYDGTTKVNFTYVVENALKRDNIQLDVDLSFENANVGSNKKIVINKLTLVGENVEKYDKKYNLNMFFASIFAKNVEISSNSVQKVYGEEDPNLQLVFDGVVEGEEIVGELERNKGEDVGTYDYDIPDSMKFQNSNYSFSKKQDIKLTIVEKNVDIEILNQQKQFGDVDPEIQCSYQQNSFAFDETFEILKTGTLQRESGDEIGRYKYGVGSLSFGKNYKINIISNGVLTIVKRDIKIIANNFEKVYGEDDPNFTFETQNAISHTLPEISLKREKGENVGKYKITYESLDDPHYNIDFVSGNLEISPRAISIKVDDSFKYYGEEDPSFDFVLISGSLQFDDELGTLLCGSVLRTEGEDVGDYTVEKGSLSAGENYDLTVASGTLSIFAQELVLRISDLTKFYGENDPDFVYVVQSGSLVGDDMFSGTAQRKQGENIGEYKLEVGTLEISTNYDVKFVCGVLNILPRQIEVTAIACSKIYGEDDPEFVYEITSGSLVEETDLVGGLYREHVGEKLYENVGKYSIFSNLSNPNYEISYREAQLSILQREIVVTTDDCSSVYGEGIKTTFDYVLTGEILEGDVLVGGLYKPEGIDAGTYPIRCNINIGRNYKVKYVQAYYEILPIELKVELGQHQKIYSNPDPIYSLQILSGNLLEGETLEWEAVREDCEDVGNYVLTAVSLDGNYVLETIDSSLEILQKDVSLSLEVLDKTYDGTAICKIKNPIVSGLVDNEIVLDYDKNNCAQFESIMPANDIAVALHDFKLVGSGAQNYNLLIPTGLFASITHASLETENVEVSTYNSTIMKYGTTLDVEEVDIGKKYNGKRVLQSMSVELVDDEGELIFVNEAMNLKIEVDNLKNYNNIQIFVKNAEGNYVEVDHKIVGNELIVSTSTLSDFIVVCDNEIWIDIAVAVCVGIFLGVGLCILIFNLKKNKKL